MPDQHRPANVTPAFLAPFASARFAVDCLVTPAGSSLFPAVHATLTPAPQPPQPPTWVLRGGAGPGAGTHALTVDAFRLLQAATARPDGSIVLGSDVVTSAGTFKAGTTGRLVSRDTPPDGNERGCGQYAAVEMTVAEKVAPPPPPPPVVVAPVMATVDA